MRAVAKLIFKLFLVAVIGLVLIITVAYQSSGPPSTSIPVSEAMRQAKRVMADNLTEANKHAVFAMTREDLNGGTSCTMKIDEFTGQVVAKVKYEAENVTVTQARDYLKAMARFWKSRSYDDLYISEDRDNYRATTEVDGYEYTVIARHFDPGSGVRLRLFVQSECVWENGKKPGWR